MSIPKELIATRDSREGGHPLEDALHRYSSKEEPAAQRLLTGGSNFTSDEVPGATLLQLPQPLWDVLEKMTKKYRRLVRDFVDTCHSNSLKLDASRTKELVID